MKKSNYKILGLLAAFVTLVSVNVIGPMEVKAADPNDFTVNFTDTTGETGNKVQITSATEPTNNAIFTSVAPSISETHPISGASFNITFMAQENSVAKVNGNYYKNSSFSWGTNRVANVAFEPRYKDITINNGVLQADRTYLVNSNVKVKLSTGPDEAPMTPSAGGYKIDKREKIYMTITLPSGVAGTVYYSTNVNTTKQKYTYTQELTADVSSISVTLDTSLPFYIYGLSTGTQTGNVLSLLGGQIVLYQNGLPLTCTSCVDGTATYNLTSYNGLSIMMISNAAQTITTNTSGTTSSIVGQVSVNGGSFENIATNQQKSLANTARNISVKFGTGTVTNSTTTGADPKVIIYLKGLTGAGLSTDLKTITVPGGKVNMKVASVDQQFGHVDLNGDTHLTISKGSKVDITLTPNSGYTAQYKVGNAAFVTGNTISITPTSDQTITIQFTSTSAAKTTTAKKDKVPKTGVFHNYVMIFGILAFIVAICVAGVVIYFKKNDKTKEKTR